MDIKQNEKDNQHCGNALLDAVLIEEGNKLIAEFDGCKIRKSRAIKYDKDGLLWGKLFSSLEYHSSWDWLMPVVDKIIEIDITPVPHWTGYRVEIVARGYVKISGFPMPSITTNVSIQGSLISATWLAVVRFIKWHNENAPKV